MELHVHCFTRHHSVVLNYAQRKLYCSLWLLYMCDTFDSQNYDFSIMELKHTNPIG